MAAKSEKMDDGEDGDQYEAEDEQRHDQCPEQLPELSAPWKAAGAIDSDSDENLWDLMAEEICPSNIEIIEAM